MELRKLLGYFILSVPFIILFIVLYFIGGIIKTLIAFVSAFGIAIFVCKCVELAFDLIDGR